MPDLQQLLELSPLLLIWFGINLLMWVAKRIPQVPNWSIPLIALVIGAVALPLFTDPGKVLFSVRCPVCLQVFQGACVGLASVGTHQLFRQIVGRFGISLGDTNENKDQ